MDTPIDVWTNTIDVRLEVGLPYGLTDENYGHGAKTLRNQPLVGRWFSIHSGPLQLLKADTSYYVLIFTHASTIDTELNGAYTIDEMTQERRKKMGSSGISGVRGRCGRGKMRRKEKS